MSYYPLTKKGLKRHFGASSCSKKSLKDWKNWYRHPIAQSVVQGEGEIGLTDSEIDMGWTGLGCQCLQQLSFDELVKRIISRAIRNLYYLNYALNSRRYLSYLVQERKGKLGTA